MQIDAVMDSDMNTNRAVEQLDFGLMAELEDLGKIAFAHLKKEDTLKSMNVVTQEEVGAIPATHGVDHDTSMKSVVQKM